MYTLCRKCMFANENMPNHAEEVVADFSTVAESVAAISGPALVFTRTTVSNEIKRVSVNSTLCKLGNGQRPNPGVWRALCKRPW